MLPPPDRLFWDGACGSCCWWVERLRRRGGDRVFSIVPYQDASEAELTPALRARARRAVVVVRGDGAVLSGADAVFYALERTGSRGWRVFRVPPLVWKAEVLYWLVARSRGFWGRVLFRDPARCREADERGKGSPADRA